MIIFLCFFYNSLIEGKAKIVRGKGGKELIIDRKNIAKLYENKVIKVEKPASDYGYKLLDNYFNEQSS